LSRHAARAIRSVIVAVPREKVQEIFALLSEQLEFPVS